MGKLKTLSIEMPWVEDVKLVYGAPAPGLRREKFFKVSFRPGEFKPIPPPKRLRNMGDTLLKQALDPRLAGPGAVGVLVNRQIYRDDTPFWLRLIETGKSYFIVYRREDLVGIDLSGRFTVLEDMYPDAPLQRDHYLKFWPTRYGSLARPYRSRPPTDEETLAKG